MFHKQVHNFYRLNSLQKKNRLCVNRTNLKRSLRNNMDMILIDDNNWFTKWHVLGSNVVNEL